MILIKLILVLILTVSSSNGFWLLNCLGDYTPFQCKCLRKLHYQEGNQWTKCYQIINQYFDDSFNYCCALREFQRCAFLMVKRRCFSYGVSLFELQMRQINSLCHVITGGYDKCEGWTPPGGPPPGGPQPEGPPLEGPLPEGPHSYRPPPQGQLLEGPPPEGPPPEGPSSYRPPQGILTPVRIVQHSP